MRDFWYGVYVGVMVTLFTLLVISATPSMAAELRIVSYCRVGTWKMATATDCFNEAMKRRAGMIKPRDFRFYCDGRRV